MRRSSLSRSLVCLLVIFYLISSVTVLLGAPGYGIRILSPATGARVAGPVTVQLTVRGGDVAYVMLAVDGELTHSTNAPPYAIELETADLADGLHVLQAQAYSRYGLLCQSAAIRVTVRNRAGSVIPMRSRAMPMPTAKAPTRGKAVAGARALPRGTVAQKLGAPAVAQAPFSPSSAAALMGPGPRPEPAPTPARALPALPLKTIASAHPLAPQSSAQPLRVAESAGSSPVLMGASPLSPSFPRGAAGVALNGQMLSFDVSPVLRQGRMETPFRPIFQAMGGKLDWRAKTRTAVGRLHNLRVQLPVNRRVALLNGREVDLGGRIAIRNSRIVVPVRPLASALGLQIAYDPEARMAALSGGVPSQTASLSALMQ